MSRVCPQHLIKIVSLRPTDTNGPETLYCPTCRAVTKSYQSKFWYVADDDGTIIGVAGQSCGGYVAFTEEEWQDIPDQIRDSIQELREEARDLKSIDDLQENSNMVSGLTRLATMADEIWAKYTWAHAK